MYEVHSQSKNVITLGALYYTFDNPKLMALGLAFGGGLGIQYHLGKHFYLEGNIDFIDAKFSDMNLGMFYPSLGFGGMF